MIQWLLPDMPFPDPEQALDDPDGLLAAGADLSVERLLSAYQSGIFPWYSEIDPILWWSPSKRGVIVPEQFHISRSLRRRARRGQYRATMNQAFATVVEKCAGPRANDGGGTWITDDMAQAYIELHRAGHAHSVEIWDGGQLVGGVYGPVIGRAFFGESMFSIDVDGSKLALWALTEHMRRCGYKLLDCQFLTDHLRSLGAVEMSRSAYISRVHTLCQQQPEVLFRSGMMPWSGAELN